MTKTVVDINVRDGADGATALIIALRHGHVRSVFEMLRYRPNMTCKDSRGNTPLHLAAVSGDYQLLKQIFHGFGQAFEFLYANAANIYTADYEGNSILHKAVSNISPVHVGTCWQWRS